MSVAIFCFLANCYCVTTYDYTQFQGRHKLCSGAISVSYRLLLQSEDVMVEELVELLVGVVDAELLERVGLEVFEAEDVQDADERGDVLACEDQEQLVVEIQSSAG